MSPAATADPAASLPVCLVLAPTPPREAGHDQGEGHALSASDRVRHALFEGEGRGDEEGGGGENDDSWIWAIDNKYYTASVRVKVLSRFDEAEAAASAEVAPSSSEATVFFLESASCGAEDARLAAKFFQRQDCDTRLWVVSDGFASDGDRENAVAFCLEEGIELVDFTEDEDEDEDEDAMPLASSRQRPRAALQACMWPNMKRKEQQQQQQQQQLGGANGAGRATPPERVGVAASAEGAGQQQDGDFEALFSQFSLLRDRAERLPPGSDERRAFAEDVASRFFQAMGGEDGDDRGGGSSSDEEEEDRRES